MEMVGDDASPARWKDLPRPSVSSSRLDAIGEADRQVPVEQRRGPRQCAGRQHVIGVDDQEIIRRGPVDAFVHADGGARIFPVRQEFDPLIAGSQRPRDRRTVIGRGIIDNQHADRDPLLREDARNAFHKETPIIVAGHHDIDA